MAQKEKSVDEIAANFKDQWHAKRVLMSADEKGINVNHVVRIIEKISGRDKLSLLNELINHLVVVANSHANVNPILFEFEKKLGRKKNPSPDDARKVMSKIAKRFEKESMEEVENNWKKRNKPKKKKKKTEKETKGEIRKKIREAMREQKRKKGEGKKEETGSKLNEIIEEVKRIEEEKKKKILLNVKRIHYSTERLPESDRGEIIGFLVGKIKMLINEGKNANNFLLVFNQKMWQEKKLTVEFTKKLADELYEKVQKNEIEKPNIVDREIRIKVIKQLVEVCLFDGIKPEDIRQFHFVKAGLNTLIKLYYSGSPYKALVDAGYKMEPWQKKFSPLGTMEDKENLTSAIKAIVKKIGKKPEEIFRKEFLFHGGGRIVRRYSNSFQRALVDAFPNYKPKTSRIK